MSIPFHPLADIFPSIIGNEFDALVADIRDNGLREPIVLFDGQILDGRNRYRACEQAGVEPRFETYDGADPAGFVVSLNLRRRHLNEGQRSAVAAKLENLPPHRPAKKDANLHPFDDEPANFSQLSADQIAFAAAQLANDIDDQPTHFPRADAYDVDESGNILELHDIPGEGPTWLRHETDEFKRIFG